MSLPTCVTILQHRYESRIDGVEDIPLDVYWVMLLIRESNLCLG